MTVSIANVPPQLLQNLTKKMLSTPQRNCIHNLFASVVEMPDNSGFIDRQSRYEALDLFPVPLDDAQGNPPAQLLDRTDVDCRVRVYSTYILLTRQVTITNQDPVLNSAAARLGQAYKETSDVLQRDNLESTASVVNCVAGENGDVPSEMSVTDVDDIVALLRQNDGEYVTAGKEATDQISTSAVGDAYGCLVSSRMIPVLWGIEGFQRKQYYPGRNYSLNSEVGAVGNVRFFESSQGSVSSNASLLGNDVANCFVTAQEGYKVVWQQGGRAKFIYTPPGYLNDPSHLRQAAACTFYQGQCITQDLWVQNLRSTGI